MQHILQHKEFSPSDLIYGFLGKHPEITEHRYRNHPLAAIHRNKLLKLLGSDHAEIALIDQVHGITCAEIKGSVDINYDFKADAQITKDRSVIIAIQTADCVPVLFMDPNKKIIGAVHAGWRGALEGVLASTLEKMVDSGANNSDIVAIIGPCIRQDSYEVSRDFLDPFLLKNKENEKFFKLNPANEEKYLFDLPGYVTKELETARLKKICDTGIDTRTDPSFFSYRRSCLAGEKLDGYNLSFIGLR